MLTHELVEVTPHIAKEWLQHNTANRRLRDPRVTAMARDMSNNAWQLNGETIKFDYNGNLIDGQHRLRAVLASGIPIWVIVVRGLEPETQDTIGTGAPRSFSDIVKWKGEASSRAFAAVTRKAVAYSRSPVGWVGDLNYRPTEAEMLTFIEKNGDDLRTATFIGDRMRRALPIGPGLAGFLYWMLAKVDRDDADLFFELLIDGSNLDRDDPIFVMREAIYSSHSKASHRGRIDERHTAAFMVRAWNAHRDGRKLRFLKYATGEPFPIPH